MSTATVNKQQEQEEQQEQEKISLTGAARKYAAGMQVLPQFVLAPAIILYYMYVQRKTSTVHWLHKGSL